MEQHSGVFSVLLKFLICGDLSPAFRGPRGKWWCLGTQFSRPRQSGDLCFVCCFVVLFCFVFFLFFFFFM